MKAKLAIAPTKVPRINAAGIIHRKLMPSTPVISFQNAINTATVIEVKAPHQTPMALLDLTNMARKNSTKSGATNKLTTLFATSNRFPETCSTIKLKATTTKPMMTEIQRAMTILDFSSGSTERNSKTKSLVITDEVEFIPDDRLDMAAANKPEITRPVNPTGNPVEINFGKS